jgi:hypothetical protein
MSDFTLNIQIKRLDIYIDTDDLENLISIIGDDNIKIIDCDEHDIPDFILGLDIDDIIQYLNNVEEFGGSYAAYCENNHILVDISTYQNYYIGDFSTHYAIVEEYLYSHSIPTAILNSIDYQKLCVELGYTLLDSSFGYYVFSE